MDNINTTLHTSRNKGKEANPYLTYLVDNYNNLSDIIVFLHAHQKGYPEAWHTDAPDYDNVNALRMLRLQRVQEQGYVNLRCLPIPGCPDEVQPFRDPPEEHRVVEHVLPDAWHYMFGSTEVPRVIGIACCSQFAVSKKQVLARPKEDYARYLQWLMETELEDAVSGRVFEYLWHIIFGQNPVL